MSLADSLDRQMRSQLRSRYRPLPPADPTMIGAAAPPPPSVPLKAPPAPIAPIAPKVPPLIPDALMKRADRLAALATRTAASLAESSDMLAEIEAMIDAAQSCKPLEVRQILRVVSVTSGVSVGDLLSDRRARHIARPRQVVMYLARKNMGLSLPKIGRAIGNRDHTTVMHAARRIEALIKNGGEGIAEFVAKCEAVLDRRGADT